ncbi:hypothetical protein M0R45_014871 [Rubus argutus]|uniref:E2 ubiquitin-conjugating enzyme n=1 Tax=Rubus argutus TaxID=59490 RepID=A0AAW1XQ78_RUBAR
MESLPSLQNSKKRVFSSSSSQCMDADDVVLIAPPSSRTSKSLKGKGAILPDVIEIEDDEDSDTAMFMDERRVDRSNKVKAIKYSSCNYPDHQAKGAVANSFFGSSGKSSASASHKVDYGDLIFNDVIDVDECARLQSHFDNVDIPPGVVAPMPPIPWLLDPPKSIKTAVSGSSSIDTKYQAAKSLASASHKVIDLDGPSSDASNSNGDYTGLYLDDSIDINEYAEMLAHFDKADIPPGIEEPIPHIPSFSDFRRSIKAVSGNSSSSLNTQKDSFSHSLGMSSSWKLPQVSSIKKKDSSLQHQWSASNFPVGVESSKLQTQTQDNVSTKQVSVMDTDETIEKFKGFKQFDTVEDHSDHHYTKTSDLTKQKNWAKKIQKEWKILEKDLPDLIFVRVYETRMDLLRAVIIGAEGTPYHDGLFFFDVVFPSAYPKVPPLVYYHSGGLRLNPNLYDTGKVCLSLLNTWTGGKKEMWIPGMSTMLQVLVSIQGLILNTEPYFNEPAYGSMKGQQSGKTKSKKYNEDTFILSLRTMVYMMKKPPKHFEDFVIGHFRNRAHDILGACKAYMDGAQVGCLVKGQVQGKRRCSEEFKHSVAGFLPILVKQFTQIGAKDCEKFLLPTTVRNKQNGSMPQAATPTKVPWWKKHIF